MPLSSAVARRSTAPAASLEKEASTSSSKSSISHRRRLSRPPACGRSSSKRSSRNSLRLPGRDTTRLVNWGKPARYKRDLGSSLRIYLMPTSRKLLLDPTFRVAVASNFPAAVLLQQLSVVLSHRFGIERRCMSVQRVKDDAVVGFLVADADGVVIFASP